MSKIWHHISFPCLMFLSAVIPLVQFVAAFNVDVRTAVIHVGNQSDGFGHAAEFLEIESSKVRLLVTAPRETVSDWKNTSGIHYYCNPLINNTCTKNYSKPMDKDDVNRRRLPISGEMQERFGLSLLAVNKSFSLICGPLWSDRRQGDDNYTFSVGRCLLGCCEELALYVNTSDYLIIPGIQTNNHAEFGFATAIDAEGRLILTAPGYRNAMGEMAFYDTRSKEVFKMDTKLNNKRDTYLGYAVTIGNFCQHKHICFAVSDRKENGSIWKCCDKVISEVNVQDGQEWKGEKSCFDCVYLFQQDVIKNTTKKMEKGGLTLLQELHCPQAFASFGASLSAIDLNGDGWSDLLVGAPLYTTIINKIEHSYDEGRVFVYLTDGEALMNQDIQRTLQPLELRGHNQMFSRFGSAIGSIGDINKDFFQDVAVGAPMENDGIGAVYIYLGGQQFSKDVSQRISGNEFKPTLTSFGYHISKPSTAIDDFQYPAFAVGCPQSGAVVVLRTRPIVNVQIKIIADPNPVKRDNECPEEVPSDVSGCLTVRVCFTVDFYFRENFWENQSLDYNLVADALVSKNWRLKLLNNSKISTNLNGTVLFTRNEEKCMNYTAAIMRSTKDPSSQLMLRITFDLNTTSFTGSVLPILNESLPKYFQEEVKFLYNCSEGQKCNTDLQLTGNLIHENSESVQLYNIVNQTRKVVIHLSVYNSRDTAFSIRLTVNVTGQIEFLSSSSMNTSHHVQCEHQAKFSSGYQLLCPIWMTVHTNVTLAVTLYFQADTVPAERENRYVTFDIIALPNIGEDEVNLTDNSIKLVSEIKISANLSVNGHSEPLSLQVNAETKNDLFLVHNYLLTNHGPSFLPTTNVTLSIPFRVKGENEFVEHLKVMIQNSDMEPRKCHVISPHQSERVESVSKNTIATTPGVDINSDSDDADPFPEIQPNRRRRRSLKENTESVNRTLERKNELNCETYDCQVFVCPVAVLQKGENALVKISFKLLNEKLPFVKNFHSLVFVTSAKVSQPDHPLFIPWRDSYVQSTIFTEIYRLRDEGEINMWIIVGGVLAGVILIMIIVVIVWKLGFFKRKGLEELERLKRESGMYLQQRSKVRESKMLTN